jgi:predicted ribosome quality control (RQC) complex YloA/Tae2 family protein
MAQKDRYSFLDTMALARELKALGHARFDKAFDLPGGRLLITLRVPGEGKTNLVVEPGKFASLVKEFQETPQEVGTFATELRKVLSGAPLLTAEQPGSERYLELAFSRSMEESARLLVMEFFGPGNVIAVKEGRIAAVASPRTWAHRTLRVGEPYARPPSRVNPVKLSTQEVEDALSRSRTSRVTTLAARLSFGGPLSEEVLFRAGRRPDDPATDDVKGIAGDIVTALATIISEVEAEPKGYLYSKIAGGELLDVEPFPSRKWASDCSVKQEVLATFSEAAFRFFPNAYVPPPSPVDEERARLVRLQTQQAGSAESLLAEMRALREKADALLANYVEVEEELKKALEGSPDVEVVEIDVDGYHFEIDPREPIRQSAQSLYEEAKDSLSKLEGARRALTETEAAIAMLDNSKSHAAAKELRKTEATRRPRTRHFWFEKAPRWFVTSEGVVVVGGRDARTNDWVVKRYLKETDIYIHADVHGAPSVVVKTPANMKAGELSVKEAGQWAVSYSKAWRAGHASADAFWVNADQVTKAGESGEYVPAGSWVIHGTKHYLEDLVLELVIGEVTYEGEMLLQAAPPNAFELRGARPLYGITPGEEKDRKGLERELAKGLGCSLETVQSLLPGGGFALKSLT